MQDLKRYWHMYRRDEIYRRETKFSWMCEDFILKLGDAPVQLGAVELERFCNKPTTFYWEQSAQWNGRCPGLIFGCIYEEWFRCHDGDPNIEFGHFFASPIQITSGGPESIAGILEAHNLLCDQAASLLTKIVREESVGVPTRSTKTHWPNPQCYTLLSTCRAIIVIIDQLNRDTGSDPKFVVLHEQSQRQSVLMVRTGEESHLSAPIDFESIGADRLPLDKTNVAGRCIDCVRVSLATAVKFIANLQRREEAAFPNCRGYAAIDGLLCPAGVKGGAPEHYLSADSWADRLVQEAEEKGYDNVFETWESVRRVKARKRGESFSELTPYHFDSRWR